MTVGEAFLVSNSSREASSIPYTALWGLSAPDITPRKGMEQMNQKARQPGFMHASLLQFFAEGVDPFLRVKATAEFELNKANKEHDRVIEEAERPLKSVKDAARAEYNEHYGKIKQIRDAAQKKLDPHGEVRLKSYQKADDEFSPHQDRLAIKKNEAYEEYKPHERTHDKKINDLRNEHYTEENKLKSRLRDAHDEYAPHAEKLRNSSDVDHEAAHEEHRPHLEAFEQAKAKAHKDFDDYMTKHDKTLDDANAELEPHKQAYNARHEAILAELQPHKDKRDAAYAAAEDVFAPHRQEYKRTMETTENSLDEARKVWRDKVGVAQQEHEDSGRADIISREADKRDVSLSRFHTQMQNAPDPKNVEYKYHHISPHGESDMHEVSVHHDGQEVGHIRWANENHDEENGNYYGEDGDNYFCTACGDSFDNFHHNEDHESVCPSCDGKDTVAENKDWDEGGSNYHPGEIGYIHVMPAYQRHGIATNLVKQARESYESGDATTRAEHSNNKTTQGRAWHQRMVEKDPKMASLLQYFASDEDPFLTIKKQEDAKLNSARRGSDEEFSNAYKIYIQNMRKAPHPMNVEYEFNKRSEHGGNQMHQVTAYHDGEEVGHVRWANDEKETRHSLFPGEIGHIQVTPEYQRHGIATNLIKKAREFYEFGDASTRIEHSDVKTDQGQAWYDRMVEKNPKMAFLLQYFASDEDLFLTIKKQEDARLQNTIDKHEDETEKNTSPNAAEELQQKIHEANETYKENMKNAPHPQNVEYRWMEARGGYGHQITAHHNGEQIGRMEWTPQKDRHPYTGNHFPGEIEWIEVDEPYRSHGIATTMLQKAHEAHMLGLADTKPQHSDIKTDEGQAWHDHLVKTLHPHASKHATVLNDKRPNQRLFAPTLTNLDPRLFDGERLRPEVRETIMNRIAAHWDENYKNWREWSRVYLAGSAVSHWWADYNAVSHAGEPGLDYHLNDDLDTLIGIEYGGLLENHPEFLGVPAQIISAELNKGLRENCNLDDIFFEVPSAEVPEWEWADSPQNGKVKVGPWSATFYVNPNSYDIRVIKPYAAYDLTNDEWAVKPVEAAEGHNFTPTEWYYFEGVAAEIMATLQLPEPARSNKAKHLWEFIHTNRNKAFRPDGQGVFDYRNVVEKYLDQLGLWQPLVNARFGVNKKEGVLLYEHEEIKQRYVEEGSYFYGAKNRNRKNAPKPGDGVAGSSSGSQSDDSILGDQEEAQPVINSHPKLSKDFGKMSVGDKKRANETIERIASGDVEGLDTHPIRYGAMSKQKPYWLSTPFGRGMRVVHRKEKDNSLTILYAGKHEYDEVVRRATAVQYV